MKILKILVDETPQNCWECKNICCFIPFNSEGLLSVEYMDKKSKNCPLCTVKEFLKILGNTNQIEI